MQRTEPPFDAQAARIAVDDLRALEREILKLESFGRIDALERVREAVRRLGEVGSPDGILARAAEELAAASPFDPVLIGQVRELELVPHSLWTGRGDSADALAALRADPIPLEYPLVEAEVVRHQRAQTVVVEDAGPRSPRRLRELLGWSSYVVVPLSLRGKAIGLLHAGATARPRGSPELDEELAAVYGDGLAGAFERATLRATLERHREELRDGVRWLAGHVDAAGRGASTWSEPSDGHSGTVDVDELTPREQEVLRLLSEGHTNSSLAERLLVSESTVKYHVKNVFRKLQATSRADAVARYLRSRR